MSQLHTTDTRAAVAFYADLFGWQSEPFGEDGELFLGRLPGYVGGEPQQPVPRDVVSVISALDDSTATGSTPHWSVDFWVADAEAAAAAAAGHGGRVLVDPHLEGTFTSAVLADPSGATFSINQLMLTAY